MEDRENLIETKATLFLDPNAVKCPTEISQILDAHIDLIVKLVVDPSKISVQEVPSLAMMAEKNKININATVYTGGLLDTEVAAINNWFHRRIPFAEKLVISGMHPYVIAHCHTLLIAHRHHEEFLQTIDSSIENTEQFVLQKAWDYLKEWTGYDVDGKEKNMLDVNSEAISILDKIMFDKSERAGIAGNDQWGLDAGPHEQCWEPSSSGPSVTQNKKREGDDDDIELQVCANCLCFFDLQTCC